MKKLILSLFGAFLITGLSVTAEITDFTPAAPEIFETVEFSPDKGYGIVRFRIPAVNTEGQPLNTPELSYHIFVDGEPYVYKAVRNPFPDGSMSAEWLPYDYSDYDLLIDGNDRYLFYHFDGLRNIAFQSRYTDSETGREWLSEMADNGVDGVEEAESGEIVAEEWYDLQGRRLPFPQGGVVIRRRVLDNGRITVTKERLRNPM